MRAVLVCEEGSGNVFMEFIIEKPTPLRDGFPSAMMDLPKLDIGVADQAKARSWTAAA